MAYRRYVDQLEWWLMHNAPEALQEAWKHFDVEEPELRPEISRQNEEYIKAHPIDKSKP